MDQRRVSVAGVRSPCTLPVRTSPLLPPRLTRTRAPSPPPPRPPPLSPCLMRAVPANAVMLFTVDKVTHLLTDH